METPRIDRTHVYVPPSRPDAWMVVVLSDDDYVPMCITDDRNVEWIRDIEQSVNLRRSLLRRTQSLTTHDAGSEQS